MLILLGQILQCQWCGASLARSFGISIFQKYNSSCIFPFPLPIPNSANFSFLQTKRKQIGSSKMLSGSAPRKSAYNISSQQSASSQYGFPKRNGSCFGTRFHLPIHPPYQLQDPPYFHSLTPGMLLPLPLYLSLRTKLEGQYLPNEPHSISTGGFTSYDITIHRRSSAKYIHYPTSPAYAYRRCKTVDGKRKIYRLSVHLAGWLDSIGLGTCMARLGGESRLIDLP